MLGDLFKLIAFGQIIIFPIILLAGIVFSIYFYKQGGVWASLIPVILLLFLLILTPTIFNNYKILNGKCKKCKGELDNKGKRIYLAAWAPWRKPNLICSNCKIKNSVKSRTSH